MLFYRLLSGVNAFTGIVMIIDVNEKVRDESIGKSERRTSLMILHINLSAAILRCLLLELTKDELQSIEPLIL